MNAYGKQLEVSVRNDQQLSLPLLSYLLTQGRNWWGELDKLFTQHIADDMDLRCLASIGLLPRNQTLSPFFTLPRQFFGHIAEDVLRRDALELL